MNENGERLAKFCMTNNYVIGGTLFTHPYIVSLNPRDKNQIDHIMVKAKWRSRSLLGVKVKRGADHLVTALIKIKLRRSEQKRTPWRQHDIEKLS